jgi:glycosyltransferase involved in cell wall biosynthesis
MQTPLRISFLDHTAKLGGAELSLLNTLEKLDRSRFAPFVILGEHGPLAQKLTAAGVDTCIVPLEPEVADAKKDQLGARSLLQVSAVWKTVQYSWRVARLMRSKKADLIHTNSLKADLIGGLCSWFTGLPLIWHIHDRLEGDYLPRPVAAIIRQLCRWMPDFVVANSQSTLKSLRLPNQDRSAVIFEGIPPASNTEPTALSTNSPTLVKAHRVALSRDTSDGASSDDAGLFDRSILAGTSQETVVVGVVGRLTQWKGQHVLIEAAALVRQRFPNVTFQIIGSAMFGESSYEAMLKRRVMELGLEEYVEFLGFRDDVGILVDRLDVLVHASILEEPFGRVITEGMLGGKPVVATRGGGVPEIVIDGITGLLVPMADVGSMADAICKLLGDPILREQMGREGRKRANQHFTTDQTVPQLESVFEQVGGAHRKRFAID